MVAAAAILAAGCTSDPAPSASPTTTTTERSPAADARPADLGEVEAVFADDLAAIGLRLTDRGGLLERGGYTPTSEGTHLALYVEPTTARSPDEYAEGILATARLLGPEVMRRWPGLESFDVCQEPPSSAERTTVPPPLTQLDMTRAEVERLSWDGLTLPELLADASERGASGMRLYVADEIQAAPVFVAAAEAAGLPD